MRQLSLALLLSVLLLPSAAAALPAELANHPNWNWQFLNSGQTGGLAGADINITSVWESGLNGEGQIFAVIDSGASLTHPDLVPNLWNNPADGNDGLDNDNNGIVDDLHGADLFAGDGDPSDTLGHGTFVAGLAAGRDNDRGIVGAAPRAQLMILRVTSDNGGSDGDQIVKAINYAIDRGAKIINLSFSFDGDPTSLTRFRRAIERAETEGVLIVAAAGNQGSDNDRAPLYPASFANANLISVAATDASDRLASFSNYGVTSVSLAAPGDAITSSYVSRESGDVFTISSGTSASAPLVAGSAALLLQARPEMAPQALAGLLSRSAKRLDTLTATTISGGRLDVAAAVASLSADHLPPPLPSLRMVRRSRMVEVSWKPRQAAETRLAVDSRVVWHRAFGSSLKRVKVRLRLSRGRHQLRIMVRDQAGNEQRSAWRRTPR